MIVVAAATAIFLLFAAAMEWTLAARGFLPTARDTDDAWLAQRSRASSLGSSAMVLIGSSRMQLDVDLSVLRTLTDLEPVQLALDNSSFVPVLKGLADDPAITGTVVVDYSDRFVAEPVYQDRASRVQAMYVNYVKPSPYSFAATEAVLSDVAHRYLRSYADGARPFETLLLRVAQAGETPQYLLTLPDRSRLADYSKLEMPGFYLRTVQRTIGEDPARTLAQPTRDLARDLRSRIQTIVPADHAAFDAQLPMLARSVSQIRARGGQVLFVVLPSSGMVHDAERRRYPRATFWETMIAATQAVGVHGDDLPEFSEFECPDGSHLDFHDRARFTHILARYALNPRLEQHRSGNGGGSKDG